MTFREALAWGTAQLKSAPAEAALIDTPQLDAAVLLAHAAGIGRAAVLAAGPDPLPAVAEKRYRGFIARRAAGECVAYITGTKEFRGLEFTVSPAVLVPRPDTETLVDAALSSFPDLSRESITTPGARAFRVLDLCTGSAAVAVSLKAEMPALDVWACDISQAALNVAMENGKRLLAARLSDQTGPAGAAGTNVQPVHFFRADLFTPLPFPVPPDVPAPATAAPPPDTPAAETATLTPPDTPVDQVPAAFDSAGIPATFDIIVSNPPYVPAAVIDTLSPEVRREPRLALDGGGDGLDLIRRIIAEAPAHLAPGGSLLLEADPSQMETTRALLEKNDFSGIQIYRDLSGKERVIGGRRG